MSWQLDHLATLGARRDGLIADADVALKTVPRDLAEFMAKAGALDSASVIVALAHMAQARRVRG